MTISSTGTPASTSATSPQTRRETPQFTGITIHRDPRGRFTVRYPSGWNVFEIHSNVPVTEPAPSAGPPPQALPTRGAAGRARRPRRSRRGKETLPPVAAREGIGFAPDPQDPATVFTAWVSPLPAGVVAEDLEALREGVEEALRALEDCHVDVATENVFGNLIRFERVYTFRERQGPDDPGAIRKRKQWLLYVDRWLMCLTWQGANAEEYDYWFAMANQTFLTFEIPEALWFATDRELLAQLSHNQSDTPSTPASTGD